MSDSQQEKAKKQLRFTDEQFIWRFSPNQTDPKLLEAIFVGRESLLQNVVEKIADSASSGSTHHILLYGPRGIGKSHFAALLHHRIRHDEKLNDAVHIAWLNEDETTTSMVQLLVRIYRALCKGYPDAYSADWLNELLNQSPTEIADVLSRRLATRFEKRRLVILVENLNLLFESLGKSGQHELRTLLQEKSFASMIATSQQLFKAVTDRSEPFFGFFQQIPLKPLSLEDARSLLASIARTKGQDDLAAFIETPDGRGRVRAIHDLAGGNHRVYIVLSGFVTKESLDQLVAPFQKMADDLTPYYQERLRWISPLQRQIVELLCRVHGTVNPKEIARRLLLDQGSIGKQVRELEKIGYLNSTKRGRETYYELSEPLMRLAFEVKEQSLLEMLVEFLRVWYRPDQLQKLRSSGLSPSTQRYADAAWERSQCQPDPRIQLLKDELDKAEAEGRSHELAALWEEKAAASNSADDWFNAGYYFSEINKDFDASITCYSRAIEIDSQYAAAWHNKGVSLKNLGRDDEAITCYDKATEIDPQFAYAWNGKGTSLVNQGRYDEAIDCFDKAIEIDPQCAYAWNNKGTSLFNLGRYDEAITCYDKAIEISPQYASAWNNKGTSLVNQGRYDEAIDCFDGAIEIASQLACAWFNKGNTLVNLGRYDVAIACYDKAVEIDPHDASSWNNKGNTLDKLRRYDEAIDCFNKAVEIDPQLPYPRFGRGEAYLAQHRWDDGYESIRDAFAHPGTDPDYLGDVPSILAIIFRLSEDDSQLQSRISKLVDFYQQAARERGFQQRDAQHQKGRFTVNPLSHLADGLVKSLAKIDAKRVTPRVLESYVTAVEQRVAELPEFEIALRLFRYGIRYLISGNESEFVELIQPERRLVRQALSLDEETREL